MEDQLISFKTAKLAKEKEFDVLCEHSFSQHSDHPLGVQENSQNGFRNWNKEYVNSFSRPTQGLLQKWLREVHNIKVCITTNTEVNAKYSYIVLYPPTKGWSLSRDKFLRWTNTKGSLADESYEKVLEEGLQEALKLIK